MSSAAKDPLFMYMARLTGVQAKKLSQFFEDVGKRPWEDNTNARDALLLSHRLKVWYMKKGKNGVPEDTMEKFVFKMWEWTFIIAWLSAELKRNPGDFGMEEILEQVQMSELMVPDILKLGHYE